MAEIPGREARTKNQASGAKQAGAGDTSASTAGSVKCGRCGAYGKGAFCSSCGAALSGAVCRNCATPLSSGARFCHRCGTSTDASVPVTGTRSGGDPLAWIVAAIALVALIALVAGQKGFFGNNSPTATSGAPEIQSGAGGPAPNISQLTPREITDRLFNRVMILHEAGLKDSLQLIATTMAIPAFELHDSLDLDLRYHLGRIGEVSGNLELASAQADTILRQHPNHLLGIILSANVARSRGDSSALQMLNRRLLQAEQAQRDSSRQEYLEHKFDIDQALAAARGGTKNQD